MINDEMRNLKPGEISFDEGYQEARRLMKLALDAMQNSPLFQAALFASFTKGQIKYDGGQFSSGGNLVRGNPIAVEIGSDSYLFYYGTTEPERQGNISLGEFNMRLEIYKTSQGRGSEDAFLSLWTDFGAITADFFYKNSITSSFHHADREALTGIEKVITDYTAAEKRFSSPTGNQPLLSNGN